MCKTRKIARKKQKIAFAFTIFDQNFFAKDFLLASISILLAIFASFENMIIKFGQIFYHFSLFFANFASNFA